MKDATQVQKIRSELSEFDLSEENALNKFILAGFYEEHKLFIDAIAAYEDAIRLAPDVDSYKEAYEEFLLRNKLKEPK
jgi:tetratricopeptide (TPR) repeat protein